jgi:hypothetical protein
MIALVVGAWIGEPISASASPVPERAARSTHIETTRHIQSTWRGRAHLAIHGRHRAVAKVSQRKTAPEPPPPPVGQVLFRGTFDSSGFSGWYVQSLPGRASTSSSDPYQGISAAHFEVRDGDVEPNTGSERSEVSGPTFNEGQDIYVRDAIRVPSSSTYQGPWQIIQQLHETEWGGSPGIAVFLNEDHSLQIGAGDGSPTYWQGPQLQTDRWYDLVYHVKLSQDSSVGFVEVWLDGAQQTLLNGQARMYGQTIQTAHTYLKVGIYRSKSSTDTSIVEHDDIVVGTSLAAVMGG